MQIHLALTGGRRSLIQTNSKNKTLKTRLIFRSSTKSPPKERNCLNWQKAYISSLKLEKISLSKSWRLRITFKPLKEYLLSKSRISNKSQWSFFKFVSLNPLSTHFIPWSLPKLLTSIPNSSPRYSSLFGTISSLLTPTILEKYQIWPSLLLALLPIL